jgi:hypothetical protein
VNDRTELLARLRRLLPILADLVRAAESVDECAEALCRADYVGDDSLDATDPDLIDDIRTPYLVAVMIRRHVESMLHQLRPPSRKPALDDTDDTDDA